ncbi:MAG: InlB B-repeat-containing protein, partial [Clostridia bacterium]|nr:InlB B-repeat-containing protein [Clostridia bacterium]
MKKFITALLLTVMCVCVGLAVGCSKKYTVTFDAAGGAFSGGRPTVEVKVAKGEAVDIEEEPTKESANFLYWAVNGQEYVFSTPVNGNLTISAVWQEIYTVTFSAGD